MPSIINEITLADLRKCNKKDFTTAYFEVKNNISNIENLIGEIKIIALGIVEIAEKFNLNIRSKKLNKEILIVLENSNDLALYGLSQKVREIIYPETKKSCVSCPLIDKSGINYKQTKQIANNSLEVRMYLNNVEGLKVIEISTNILNITGYSQEEFLKGDINFEDLIHEEDKLEFLKKINLQLKGNTNRIEHIYRIKTKNKGYIYIENIIDLNFKNGEIFSTFIDITRITTLKKELKQIAYFDQHTKLPNEKKLEIDLENLKGKKRVIVIKIKNFSIINTSYTFNKGDEIIIKLIEKLKIEFGNLGFKLYRIGKMNFGLIKEYNYKDKKNKKALDVKIKGIISNFYINYDDKNINLDINAGYASDHEALLNNARIAAYQAKNNGELIEYNKELEKKLKKESENKIKWTDKIRNGLENNYFIPYYQGIRDNKTGKINKYEALVRYSNGNELISPFHFLEIAKETGLIGAISLRMIDNVLKDMKYHNNEISINLTEGDFQNDDTISVIIESLKGYKINPNRLITEVLENITEDIDDHIIKNIRKIQNIGVKISIDDFGTGNSNFERINKIKPDFLKIDGSLVKLITKDIGMWNTVNGIVQFAHNMGAKVIAEYVENEEIQKELEKMKVDFSQGFLYSKPSRDIIENKN